MKFVYGNKERIFVNTALGCRANCAYCYLPDVKSENYVNYISAEEAIRMVESDPFFRKGEEGTIISVGCYSECLDKDNAFKTKAILEHFLPMGNYIQLATKQEITQSIIDTIVDNRSYREQVCVYISLPTISGISLMERGTTPFQIRIDNIERCKSNGIITALYIKPFLERITVDDKDKYIDIVKKYNMPVIIGGFLSVCKSASKSDVGEDLLYEQEESPLYEKFVLEFGEMCTIYKHSIELIRYLRERRKNTNDRRLY